ncbi:hypothetical protein Hokovirus_1_12 [Hokovirus HKV1]|uniref:Macro domain-containing protein n=1 Tax=Hokovirus HKV1 TaxID=1977638 RepID=A0A1V0SEJ0_9VIRU|nr:hypothetical protein Hokovirus_1_12 [Hokovirus HKV1]
MILINQSLFNTKDNTIAHCVSSDFKLGAGIAKIIKNKYPILPEGPPNLPKGIIGNAHGIQNDDMLVFHLVTKPKYYDKPTYDTLTKSLISLKNQLLERNIKSISMPKIGCGLDKLEWSKVSEIIENVFSDTNIIVSVYYL